jgi:hypothetical protein
MGRISAVFKADGNMPAIAEWFAEHPPKDA